MSLITCPHCGHEAEAGPKFCQACSRLIDSPLLPIKRELDAMREQLRGHLASPITRRPHAAPSPSRPPRYRVSVGPSSRSRPRSSSPEPTTIASVPPMPAQHTPRPSPAYADIGQTLHDEVQGALGRAERSAQGQLRDQLKQRQQQRKGKKNRGRDATHSGETHRFENAVGQQPAKAAEAVETPPERLTAPAAFKVLILMDLLAAATLAYVAWTIHERFPEPRASTLSAVVYGTGFLGFLYLLAALNLSRLRESGATLQRLVSLPLLAVVPFGTIFAILVNVYLTRPSTKLLFSGTPPRQMSEANVKTLVFGMKASPAWAILLFVLAIPTGLGAAAFALATVPVIEQYLPAAMVPVAADPAAVEPEAGSDADPQTIAVDDVQAMMRGQAAYASLNEGLHDRVECVVRPDLCIRNKDPRNAAKLLDPKFTRMTRGNYVFELLLSDPPEERPAGASATGMRAYAYRATPAKGSGHPGFCGDETGMLCTFDPNNPGVGPPLRCPSNCIPLEK